MTQYPDGFPAPAVVRVEAAIAAAERDFAQTKGDFQAVADFVVDVADAFLTEVRRLLKDAGNWSPTGARVETGRFMDGLIDESYRDKFNPVVRQATSLVPGDISYFDPHAPADRHEFGTRLRAEICRLPSWSSYLEALQSRLEASVQARESSTESSRPTRSEPDQSGPCVFNRARNGTWALAYRGIAVSVEHVEGLELIRRLLESPHVAKSALELVGRTPKAAGGGNAAPEVSKGTPAFDSETRRAMEARLTQLQNEIEIAVDVGDQGRAEELRREESEIEAYVRKGTAIGGRPRLLDSDLERARKAASRRYETALKKIDQKLPALAGHLRTSIQQGNTFMYAPDSPLPWETSGT